MQYLLASVSILLINFISLTEACSGFSGGGSGSSSGSGTGGTGGSGTGGTGTGGTGGSGTGGTGAVGEIPDINSALGGTANLAGAMPSSGGGPINQASDLVCCEFDGSCRWHNEPGTEGAEASDEFDFGIADGQPSTSKSNLYFGTKQLPETTWLLTGSSKKQSKTNAALLVSDIVPCQEGDAIVSFNYWMTPGTEIKVCTRRPDDGKNFIQCSSSVKRPNAPGPAEVSGVKGEGTDPFEIVIVAQKFDYKLGKNEGGLILLDCLEYVGTLCGDEVSTTAVPPPPPTPPPPPGPGPGETTTFGPPPTGGSDFEACQIVSCGFEGQCDLSGEGWKTEASAPIGNIHTGVRTLYDGPFSLFEGPQDSPHFVTKGFELSEDRAIHFCKYRATAETFLTVTALGNSPTPLFEDVRLKSKPHVWDCMDVPLKRGSYQALDFSVHGDAIQRLPVAYYGIDDIKLLDRPGGQPLC